MNRPSFIQSRQSAFTLIELLVVIGIIAILAAILFPVFAQAKAAAKATVLLSNTKQIALAHILYMNDADDRLCPEETLQLYSGGADWFWQILLQPYTKSFNVFGNPLGVQNDPDPKDFNKLYGVLNNWGAPPRGSTFYTYRAPGATDPGNWKFGDNARGAYVTGGRVLAFDGLFGYAVDRDRAYGDARITAPSRTGTEVASPSETLMVCQSGNYHMGWADPGDEGYGTGGFKVFQYMGPAQPYPGYYFFAGPFALKNPKPNGAGYLYSVPSTPNQTANGIPDGIVIYATVDGSAKARQWRATFTKGTPVPGAGYSTMDVFWPQGNGG